jgi:flagellar motor switch protein FliN/FliY
MSQEEVRNLELLRDVQIVISVELGRKSVPLGEILHMVRGSVVELEKLAGEPVDVYANGQQIATGEVVVVDEHFGVRITQLVSAKERLESLG